MVSLRQLYEKLWVSEGINKTNEHLEHYFERSMKIPALIIDMEAHFVFVFPGKDSDYEINCKGIIQ